MAKHEVMRSFEDVRKKSAKVREDNDVSYIWKQGFPVGTDYAQAIAEATALAKSQGNVTGDVVNSEIIQTPEHEANGEFLVSLTFGREVKTNGPKDH